MFKEEESRLMQRLETDLKEAEESGKGDIIRSEYSVNIQKCPHKMAMKGD